MGVKIIRVHEDSDPLSQERGQHRRLALQQAMKNPGEFTREQRIDTISSADRSSSTVRLGFVEEVMLEFGDPFSDQSGEGVASTSMTQQDQEEQELSDDSDDQQDESQDQQSDDEEPGQDQDGQDQGEDGDQSQGPEQGDDPDEDESGDGDGEDEGPEQGEDETVGRGQEVGRIPEDREGGNRRSGAPQPRGEGSAESEQNPQQGDKDPNDEGEGTELGMDLGLGFGSESGDKEGPDGADESADSSSSGVGAGAGNETGEDTFETEVSTDEIYQAGREEFELPSLEEMDFGALYVERTSVPQGMRTKGPRSLLRGRDTAKERHKRSISTEGDLQEGDDPIWREEDQRYRRKEDGDEPVTNAVIHFVRDASASMNKDKTYTLEVLAAHIARAIRKTYIGGDVVIHFVTFDTEAQEWGEQEFLEKTSSGGTNMSAGAACVTDCIRKRYPTETWNHFVFFFSDGDNSTDDVETMKGAFEELERLVNLMASFAIFPSETMGSTKETLAHIADMVASSDKFFGYVLEDESDVRDAWFALIDHVKNMHRKKGSSDG